MALTIVDEETCLAVERLAAVTGLSITEAIHQAVEEKLSRILTHKDRIEKILAIGRDCAARLSKEGMTQTHGEVLYDSDGLPM